MTVAEIIEELPKLSESELRSIRLKLVEIAEAQNEDIAICNHSADEGARMLDNDCRSSGNT